MIDLYLLRSQLRYKLEHPVCNRCGKEIYIPRPPKELYESWGIMCWTAFVKQYIKHHGWYELDNLHGNIVCDKCLHITDRPNTIMNGLKNIMNGDKKQRRRLYKNSRI